MATNMAAEQNTTKEMPDNIEDAKPYNKYIFIRTPRRAVWQPGTDVGKAIDEGRFPGKVFVESDKPGLYRDADETMSHAQATFYKNMLILKLPIPLSKKYGITM